ncbi:MAG: DUF4350 domain-containing protein [Chitinophagaceae bacterium]
MKNNLLYIALAIVVGAAIAMFIINNRWARGDRKLEERLTLHRRDKIPYGLNVAYSNLQSIFPDAEVVVNKKEPGSWDRISSSTDHQALIIITPDFNADDYEMKELVKFVEAGNDVFLSTRRLSNEAQIALNCSVPESSEFYGGIGYLPDTLEVQLAESSFPGPYVFRFPGKRFSSWFSGTDATTSTVLGMDKAKQPNFIKLRAGTGHFYVQLVPMAFSNYFLLHKANMAYYEEVLSVIPANTSTVAWDEYYRYKVTQPPTGRKNWLSVLMNIKNSEGQKPFKAALLTAMLLLLLYVLLGIRRKQRIIPIIRKPGNSSLDFTKTIGRLYHDKGDHANLARKMSAYFLEYVRTRYKLVTSTLDENFIQQLHFKSGVEESVIASIVNSIHSIERNQFTAQQLAAFHKQLEIFYKTA